MNKETIKKQINECWEKIDLIESEDCPETFKKDYQFWRGYFHGRREVFCDLLGKVLNSKRIGQEDGN